MQNNKQKLWILLGVIVVIFLIILVAAQGKKTPQKTGINNQAKNEQAKNNPVPPTPGAPVVNSALKDAVAVVPGANLVSKDNKVLTIEGDLAQNSATPMSPQAPHQTGPIDKGSLSDKVVKLTITTKGWSPNSFTVKAGEPVSLSVTSGDVTHIFKFDDPSLSAVALGLGDKETRAITFNAPTKAGEYTFHCDVPGHTGRGEVGKMIVK
jgi:heme/copper-type cytochrome/quinol oxidase subunit 2